MRSNQVHVALSGHSTIGHSKEPFCRRKKHDGFSLAGQWQTLQPQEYLNDSSKCQTPGISPAELGVSRENKGAAVVDGVRFEDVEAPWAENWFGELAEKLRTKGYRPEVVKREADIIIANLKTDALADMADKVYTCDLFGSNS